MKAKFILSVAVLLLASGPMWASDISGPIGVFVDPDTTSFWRTASSSTFTVDLDYPSGATSVSIDVVGAKFHRRWEGVTAGSWTLELPATENVYALSFAFDDGTTNNCSFAVIASQANGAEAVATMGQTPGAGDVVFNSVLPVPFGTSALTVDDVPVVNGCTGPQGWFVCGKMSSGEHSFALTADREYDAQLKFVAPGMAITIR